MTIYKVLSIQEQENGHTLKADVQLGEQQHTINYTSPDISFHHNLEAMLSVGLLPSMKQRATARLNGEISPRFLSGIEAIQSVFRSWKPGYGHVRIEGAVPKIGSKPDARRVGVFFSTGVDASYSFLKHKDEVTDLIYIRGFDITAGDWRRFEHTALSAHRIAEHYGKNLIEVGTDLRSFTDQYVFWGMAHGSGMASIGHLMSDQFKRIYIAASLDLNRQIHWGTHPQLDPHWSTETLEFVHDGTEARRIDKIERIASEDIILQNLRVCVYPPREKPNCGRCEKCVRTMIALKAVGALDRCPNFEAQLDPQRIFKLYAPEDRLHQAFVAENLEMLEKTGNDPELARALRRVQRLPAPVKKFLRMARELRSKTGRPSR